MHAESARAETKHVMRSHDHFLRLILFFIGFCLWTSALFAVSIELDGQVSELYQKKRFDLMNFDNFDQSRFTATLQYNYCRNQRCKPGSKHRSGCPNREQKGRQDSNDGDDLSRLQESLWKAYPDAMKVGIRTHTDYTLPCNR